MASHARKNNWYGTWGKGGKRKNTVQSALTVGKDDNDGVEGMSKLALRDRSKSVSSHDLSRHKDKNADDVEDETCQQRGSKASIATTPGGPDDEQQILRYQGEAKRKLEELVATEKSYIKDLEEMCLYIGYIDRCKKSEKGCPR